MTYNKRVTFSIRTLLRPYLLVSTIDLAFYKYIEDIKEDSGNTFNLINRISLSSYIKEFSRLLRKFYN